MSKCALCQHDIEKFQSKCYDSANRLVHMACMNGKTPATHSTFESIAPKDALKHWEYAKKNKLRRYHNRDKSRE